MPNYLLNKLKKNALAMLAKSDWEKKAIWLAADHPQAISHAGKSLRLDKIGLIIVPGQHEFLLDGYSNLEALQRFGGFKFTQEGETILARKDQLTVEVHTAEELFILNEVFLRHEYDFLRPGRSVVIDVGMNVGFASLYFASRPDVELVYGFEPMEPTFQLCERNMSRNPELSRKIIRSPYGLASENRESKVRYDFARKGQTSIEVGDESSSDLNPGSIEKAELKAIRPEIDRLSALHDGFDIVLKIDCEGGEYDLFRSFSSHGIPSQIKTLLMEWHAGDHHELGIILRNEGFSGVKTFASGQKVGMLCAFRS